MNLLIIAGLALIGVGLFDEATKETKQTPPPEPKKKTMPHEQPQPKSDDAQAN